MTHSVFLKQSSVRTSNTPFYGVKSTRFRGRWRAVSAARGIG